MRRPRLHGRPGGVVRVSVWPADEGGCGHYRMTWPAQALAAQGADIGLVQPSAKAGGKVLLQEDEHGATRCLAYLEPPDADVVVIQRPLAARRADAIPLLQAHGIRVVVEIDDCFETIHPRNASWYSTHPRRNPDWNRAHLARACRQADLVTVTTPTLARRYAGHGRVAVIPNYVPAHYLDIQPQDDRVSVGWTGSLETHPTDLQVTRGAVERALASTDPRAPFRVVGTGVGVQRALTLAEPPVPTGWVDLDQYPKAMAGIGVGVVPLDDIAFNRAKSALKLMEFSALGVPAVASPTPDNLRMHAEGCGLIAAKPKHWLTQVRRLLTDDGWRAEVAGRSRETMRRHTIEGNCDRWWDAWATTLTKREKAA